MAEHLKDARPLADMLFMRETDGERFDTPEQRAALERRLGEAVGKIADETLRRHYQADMKRRLLGVLRRRTRAAGREATPSAKQAFVPRRGGPFPPRGPRIGVAEAPLAPQSKLGRSARLPAREVMILSIALGHPALIESHCEELAATEFMGAGVNALRDALLAAPADALDFVRGARRMAERAPGTGQTASGFWPGRKDAELVVHAAGGCACGRRSGAEAKLGLASAGGRVT